MALPHTSAAPLLIWHPPHPCEKRRWHPPSAFFAFVREGEWIPTRIGSVLPPAWT